MNKQNTATRHRKTPAARQDQTAKGTTYAPGWRWGGQQTVRTADERQSSRQEQSSKGKEKERSTARQRPEPQETEGGGGGSNHQGGANGRAGNTKAARANGEPSSRRPAEQIREAGGGGQTKRTADERRASRQEQRRQKKRGRQRAAATKTARHKRGGGGLWGGCNHQGAANSQAGNTKAARAHAEPRRGGPTKQTTHSTKAQGTRGRKPEKARDNGGAQQTMTKEKRKKKI